MNKKCKKINNVNKIYYIYVIGDNDADMRPHV